MGAALKRIFRMIGIIFAAIVGLLAVGLAYQALTFKKDVDLALMPQPAARKSYLVCPPDFCTATPHRTAKIYNVPVSELQAAMELIRKNERANLVSSSADGLQRTYVQYTRLMRFPDYITVKFIPLAPNRSTLAIYSRSKYGNRDYGVNKRRIEAWLDALEIVEGKK